MSTIESRENTLNGLMTSHARLRVENDLKKTRILESFSQWVNENTYSEWHLSLSRFAKQRPLCYFDPAVVEELLSFFHTNSQETVNIICNGESELSQAIFSMLRPSISWEKEEPLSLDTPQNVVEFENIWHPEYLRYSEQIYNHLIQIPLGVLDKVHSKNYTGGTLSDRVQHLNRCGLILLSKGIDTIIRNALSHGHVRYGFLDITYQDAKKPPKTLDPTSFGQLLDLLTDTCSAFLIAILLFICENKDKFIKKGLKDLPLGLKFLLVDGFTCRNDLELQSLIEMEAAGKRQLNLIYKIKTHARSIHQFETVHLCWMMCQFGGEYDRYFAFIDCNLPLSPTLAIDGNTLQNAIVKNLPLSECKPLIESSALWYDTPNWYSNIQSLLSIMKAKWPMLVSSIKSEILNTGVEFLSDKYCIVETKNTSPSSIRRLEINAVLNVKGEVTSQQLNKIIQHIFKQASKKLIRKKNIYGEKGILAHPQYITIRLFARKKRLRQLISTWENDELVLIAEWSRNWKKAAPAFTRVQSHIIEKRYRIKFNEKLVKQQSDDVSPARLP